MPSTEIKCCITPLPNICISVYGIYIERLLNRHWKLTSTNIDIEEKYLDEMVLYFDKWLNERLYVKEKEKIMEREVNKYYMSVITYNNTMILVRGFIQYSRCIVTIISPDIYVPALHSNQSSLEGFFLELGS